MTKWTYRKFDFTETWKKIPHITRYSWVLMDNKGFSRGHVTYRPLSKTYTAYSDKRKYFGDHGNHLLGEYKHLTDAKRALESDWEVKITPARRKTKSQYGIKGKLRPFGL